MFHKVLLNVKKEKLLSLTNIVIMTFSYILLGLLINVVILSQTGIRYLEQQAQITVFFKDDFTVESITKFREDLTKDARVSNSKYVSKEDAFKIFREMNKDEPILLESISVSILPASVEVWAKNIKDLNALAESYKAIDGVEEVRFFNDVVDRFRTISFVAYVLGFVLAALFMGISYSIIVTTLRTTVISRGKELEIMKLVGATDKFVKSPFIYQGVFYSVIASVIAGSLMILAGIGIFKSGIFPQGLAIGFIHGVYFHPILAGVVLALVLILSGFILGYLGSSTAVKKYLKY